VIGGLSDQLIAGGIVVVFGALGVACFLQVRVELSARRRGRH
jgi:hypothetical protein